MNSSENTTVYFCGISGQYYPFTLYSLDEERSKVGCVYIYTRKIFGTYKALYIGETDVSLNKFVDSETWKQVNRLNVDSLCIYIESDVAVRIEMVRDLVKMQRPPGNEAG